MKNETEFIIKFNTNHSSIRKLEKKAIELKKTLEQINVLTEKSIELKKEIEKNSEITINVKTIEVKPKWFDRLLIFQ